MRRRPQGLSLERAARLLGVARSQVYRPSPVPSQERLRPQIEAVLERFGSYGYRRVAAQLEAQGELASPKKVRRAMQKAGLAMRRPRRGKRTTFARKMKLAQNLVGRTRPTGLNQIWACDVTAIRVRRAWCYAAIVLDVCSRKIVGWAVSGRNDTMLTLAALGRALASRRPEPGWIHHSDRGSNYTAPAYVEFLQACGGRPSYADPGSPRQNAFAESFFKSLKTEDIDEVFADLEAVRHALDDYITLYNEERRHSSLRYQSPDQFESRLAAG